jgi:hypothetical protein
MWIPRTPPLETPGAGHLSPDWDGPLSPEPNLACRTQEALSADDGDRDTRRQVRRAATVCCAGVKSRTIWRSWAGDVRSELQRYSCCRYTSEPPEQPGRGKRSCAALGAQSSPWQNVLSRRMSVMVDLTACRNYVRRLLDTQAFRGPLCNTTEAVRKSRQKAKLTRAGTYTAYYQGKLPAEAVWALPPALRRWPRACRRKKDLHHECPYMLDVASLPSTCSVPRQAASALTPGWRNIRNTKTASGLYRPLVKWTSQHERLHYVCVTFRGWHRSEGAVPRNLIARATRNR